ncbi:MAG: T9SS type A sorting domain-containing protein [Janthinobacterium lividum]
MKSSLHKLVALLLVAGLSTTTVLAARGPHPGPGGNPEARREEREYLKTKVLPVLQQQRQQLEQELAPADRTQLATYRTQLKALAKREMALHQAAHAAARPAAPDSTLRHRGRPELTPEMQAARTERREIMQQVAQLAQKYQANIARIAAALKPQQTQWMTDLHAIMQKNRPAESAERSAPGNDAPMASRPAFHRSGPGFSELHLLHRPTAFLLLDPGAATLAEEETVATSLYPNPVAPTSQLQYQVKQAGPVTVQILDKNGNTLRTAVQATQQEKGPHSQAIDLSELSSGTYFYKVTTATGTETKRFVKE